MVPAAATKFLATHGIVLVSSGQCNGQCVASRTFVMWIISTLCLSPPPRDCNAQSRSFNRQQRQRQ